MLVRLLALSILFSSAMADDVDLSRYAVKLRDGNKSQASGVNTSIGVITCQHVVDGLLEMSAECDGEIQQGEVIWSNTERDLAVLKVKWTKPHSVPKMGTVKKSLTVVGRGDNGLLRTSRHTYIEVANNEITFTDPRNTGASGSGLFNEQGELVGIFLGKIVDNEPYIGRAAKIEDVKITVRK